MLKELKTSLRNFSGRGLYRSHTPAHQRSPIYIILRETLLSSPSETNVHPVIAPQSALCGARVCGLQTI